MHGSRVFFFYSWKEKKKKRQCTVSICEGVTIGEGEIAWQAAITGISYTVCLWFSILKSWEIESDVTTVRLLDHQSISFKVQMQRPA